MSKSSLRSSPWILGAPQSGLANDIFWMRALSSEPAGGRPGRGRLDCQVEKGRNPCRCQRMTVSGRTKHKASRQPDQRCERQTQKMRATLPNCGRLERLDRRANCCRSARFSSARWRRDFKAERTERNRASRVDHMSGAASSRRKSPSSQAIEIWQSTAIQDFLPSAQVKTEEQANHFLEWWVYARKLGALHLEKTELSLVKTRSKG